MNLNKYRVTPGETVNLKTWDADDRSAVRGSKAEALETLAETSKAIDRLQDILYASASRGLLIVLQGMDTSGKDGVIRHVFNDVDPLGVRAVGFKAPTAQELAHDFLWRVHQQVPGKGEIVLFNRSHYEDVLIVRVHKWITDEVCRRRCQQINDFERMLVDNGTTVLKFYLHISKDEQRTRLQERVDTPDKRWKFNPKDVEERARWNDYMRAYEDALSATSTAWAPWHVVPANSKTNRNIVVSTILKRSLEELSLSYPAVEWDPKAITIP